MDATLVGTILSLQLLFIATGPVSAAKLKVLNSCEVTIWPGLLSLNGSLSTTGFALDRGQYRIVDGPARWSGRVWARTHCITDRATYRFTCDTGDCPVGMIQCANTKPAPPVTRVEFTLDATDGLDYYDVSLVDGFNLPVQVTPYNDGNDARGNCAVAGCPADMVGLCPWGLVAKGGGGVVLGCNSACVAFNKPDYCCTEQFSSQQSCLPSSYSKLFKDQCPTAFSYPFDHATSVFSCPSGTTNYLIEFCPNAGTYGRNRTSSAAPRIAPAVFLLEMFSRLLMLNLPTAVGGFPVLWLLVLTASVANSIA